MIKNSAFRTYISHFIGELHLMRVNNGWWIFKRWLLWLLFKRIVKRRKRTLRVVSKKSVTSSGIENPSNPFSIRNILFWKWKEKFCKLSKLECLSLFCEWYRMIFLESLVESLKKRFIIFVVICSEERNQKKRRMNEIEKEKEKEKEKEAPKQSVQHSSPRD